MRLVFEKRKQTELIKKELAHLDLSLPQLASRLNIKLGRLNAFYYDGALMPEEIFNKFTLKDDFEKHIIEKKEENWGQKLGGKNSIGSYTKEVNCPKETKELAEFYGIMLGDGNLSKIKGYKVANYQIRIVGDSRFDKDYLINFVKPLIEKLFEINVNVYKIKDGNGLNINAYGLRLVEFLESKGFTPGDKIRNQITIPNWIKKNEIFLKSCLRGLFDTDGSVYKITNQNSHQISFRNYNITLLTDVRNSLISLGITPSRITKGNEILITKKSELRKFLNDVGFHNSKHLNKAKMWNLAL